MKTLFIFIILIIILGLDIDLKTIVHANRTSREAIARQKELELALYDVQEENAQIIYAHSCAKYDK